MTEVLIEFRYIQTIFRTPEMKEITAFICQMDWHEFDEIK
jgi:hypothetical protein